MNGNSEKMNGMNGHCAKKSDMICGYCKEAGNLLCTGCKNVYYCGKEHQLLDWRKDHRSKCKAFEVLQWHIKSASIYHHSRFVVVVSKIAHKTITAICSLFQIAEHESMGRYMRACRMIKAGEIILREKPLIYGPKIISAPICLGCNRFVKPQDIPVDEPSPSTSSPGIRNRIRKLKVKTQRNYYKCSKCKWPVCNAECEKSSAHLAECQLMAEKNFQCNIDYNEQDENRKESAYCAILPLRCLLQKKTSDDGWREYLFEISYYVCTVHELKFVIFNEIFAFIRSPSTRENR